ncbi:MAG: aldehyde ferredoxin oxidoreductase family protein [Desulfobacterales bacterium]|nr:aldehyde ferredoxin oxidoreductase family protein [Desulfobacterales bacterium]
MLTRKIAYIDLTRGTVQQEVIPLEWREKYLGARGINMHLLSSLIHPGMDPLGPENPLIFGVGLLTGALGFGAGRFNLTAMSPACGNIGDSNCGGHFGAELKYAGFDHLVITGKSADPVYLEITNDRIEIKAAGHLWGKDTWQTQLALKEELGDSRVQVAAIGVAGENQVRFANVVTGPKDTAGRTGMGAVMGAKNLKALAVRGSKDVTLAHPRQLLAYFKTEYDRLMERKWIKALGRLGTPLLFSVAHQGGWRGNRPVPGGVVGERGKHLYAENLLPFSVGMAACTTCAVHCRHRHLVPGGKFGKFSGEGPEYGAIMGVGLELGNFDLESVLYFSNRCNHLGLDVTQLGIMINFAMRLYQDRIIDAGDTGQALEGGDIGAIEKLIEDIAHRRGFGDILADGAYALENLTAKAAGHMHLIKNMPAGPPGWGAVKSFAMSMGVASLPGHVHRSRPGIDVLRLPADVLENLYGGYVSPDFSSYEGKARMIWWHELLNTLCDSLGNCRFQTVFNSPHAPQYREYSELIRLSTGLEMPVEQLKETAERIYTTERLLLIALGVGSRKDDLLPAGWMTVEGPTRIDRDQYEKFLDQYYALHGWDAQGRPTPQTLERLGLKG